MQSAQTNDSTSKCYIKTPQKHSVTNYDITDLLMTVSWSDNSHPTGMVNLRF